MRPHNGPPIDPWAGHAPAPAGTQTPNAEAFQLSEHRQVWDAIAWVVAGSATPEQVSMVREHLLDCRHCRDEQAYQQQIHRGMQESPQAPDEAAIQSGLDRLWARDRDEADVAQLGYGRRADAHHDAAPAWSSATAVASRGRSKRWLIMAVSVQAVAICVLGLRMVYEQPPQDFVTLSQPAGLPPGAILRLVPEGHIDMNSLRRLLTQHGLRIVGADEDASSLLLAPLYPDAVPIAAVPSLAEHLRVEPGVMLVVPVGEAAPGVGR